MNKNETRRLFKTEFLAKENEVIKLEDIFKSQFDKDLSDYFILIRRVIIEFPIKFSDILNFFIILKDAGVKLEFGPDFIIKYIGFLKNYGFSIARISDSIIYLNKNNYETQRVN